MSNNTARLTLYYLISSFEADMRRMIDNYLSTKGKSEEILAKEAFARISERARSDGLTGGEIQVLSAVLDYFDFGDLIQVCRSNLNSFPVEFQNTLRLHQAAIDGLAPIRNRVMHGRPLEFDDLAKALDLIEGLLNHPDSWPETKRAASDLSTRPEVLFGITIPVIADHDRTSHNLPLPDFDETGFIGRKDSLRQVLGAIKGVYPVITIVGEGGLGKTSLALKAAYDVLDHSGFDFDAIIFVSAKTSQLTATEIRRIEGAVTSSVGLLSAAVEALSGETRNPIEDLVQILSDFKVLLILDNLETVIDENVRMLARSMPAGSKLLVTSRIGLGAFEYPITLEGLSSREATQLLRAFAKVSGVDRLARMPDDRLQKYGDKMRNNPLHIKWFVAAVRAGKRPEEILADERMFLKFCLSNVYEQLSEAARKVVRTLLSVGGANTTSEISYLSGLDEASTIRAIQELLTTNMFIASSMPVGLSFKTKYELSQLSRSYLARFYSVAKEEQERLMKAKRQLVSMGEQLVADSKKNPLSPYLIHCRDRSDVVPAKHLSDGLRAMRAGDFDAAHEAVSRARALAPEFYEVARVEAWLFAHSGSISEAFDAYERAVELEPNAAHVRMFFGGFLLLSVQDTELALVQYKVAHELLPEAPEPATELARCYLYLKQYDLAQQLVDSLRSESDLTERIRRKVRDLKIQIFQRRAEDDATALAPIEALCGLERLREYCSTIDFLDQRMKQRLASTSFAIGHIRQGIRGNSDLEERIDSFADWVQGFLAAAIPVQECSEAAAPLELATFLRGAGRGKFGFARTDSGLEVFIHHSQFLDGQLDTLLAGDRVSLTLVSDDLGRVRGERVRRI